MNCVHSFFVTEIFFSLNKMRKDDSETNVEKEYYFGKNILLQTSFYELKSRKNNVIKITQVDF